MWEISAAGALDRGNCYCSEACHISSGASPSQSHGELLALVPYCYCWCILKFIRVLTVFKAFSEIYFVPLFTVDGSENNRITTEAKASGISEFKFSNTQHGIFSGYTWQLKNWLLFLLYGNFFIPGNFECEWACCIVVTWQIFWNTNF